MNNAVKLCIAAALAVLFIGCGGKEVSVLDPNDRGLVSAGLDSKDLEVSAKKLVDNFLETYGANADGSEFLEVGDIINDTMQEFDVERLAALITRDLRNAKKYKISRTSAGSGGRVNTRINTHQQRDNEEINQLDVAEKGSQRLAKISLGGKIIEKVTRVNKKEQRDYFLIFNLTDRHTGEELWDAEEQIVKLK